MQAIERAFAGAMSREERPTATAAREVFRDVDAFEEARWRALVAGATTLAALLVIRPPFIMSYRSDGHRPWRASATVSWPAVGLTVLAMAAAAAALPSKLAAE
jgi:hypothetical protein